MTKDQARFLITEYLEQEPGIFDVEWQRGEDGWGSVQYSTIQSTYDLYWKVREYLSPDEAQEAFGITSTQLGTVEATKVALIENFTEMITDADPGETDWIESHKHAIVEVLKCSNFKADVLFDITRNLAWDLWSAVGFMGLQMVNPAYAQVPVATGVGPEWNSVIQEENIQLGLVCAMLQDFGYIESDECYKGFDT